MPHRTRSVKCYRVPNDVLILILEKMTPVSLYRTCKVFMRIFILVMESQHLQYKYELAVVGMQDGLAPHSVRSALPRLHLLLSYKKNWPRMAWADERLIRAPAASTKIGVSGDFVYYVAAQTIDLAELPSCRLGRSPHQTHHVRIATAPPADCVAVDSLQALVVSCHVFVGAGGQIAMRLKIRKLGAFSEMHAHAAAPHFECATQMALPVAEVSMSICGPLLITSLIFEGGVTKHLLLNWRSFEPMWLDDQDVLLLNPYYILGIRKGPGRLAINLYNIFNMSNVVLEREYELPPIWAKATMRFGRNSATNADISAPPTALFQSDPAARILVLTAKQPASLHWLFIPEAFFRPTPHLDRRSVPWSYWTNFCLIRELTVGAVVGQPQVVGSRILYLETDGGRSGRERFRMSVIDFAPYAEEHTPPTKYWTLVGSQSVLIPNESYREIPSSSTHGLAVQAVAATEDNIVLTLQPNGADRLINVLTFGPNSNPSAHQHIGTY